jgi:hypothetical protein
MKIVLLIIALTINCNLAAQYKFDSSLITKKTNKIVSKIEKENQLMSSAVGYSGEKPEQWDNFQKLKEQASKNELLELTNHPNGVVRSYSFWALSHDPNIDLFNIVKEHLSDDELINTLFGCIGGQEKVGDFFIQIVTSEYVDLESQKLSKIEFQELDSLLIYHPNKLSSRFDAINRAKATNEIYPKIRELVVKEKNPNALVSLAKFQKEQDIELIKNFNDNSNEVEDGFYFTYSAIIEFPNQAFLPLLAENLMSTLDNTHFSSEWRQLYKAIACYKNEKSLTLLEIPFTQVEHENIKKYHIEFVFEAISDAQDSIYDELLWRIWEEEYQTSIQVYKHLLSLNPARAYELTKRELIENYEIQRSNFVPKLNKVDNSENLTEYQLNVIIANDAELSSKIISQQIINTNVHNLSLFTSKVNQQELFVEPLFNRLENEWNAHIYLDLVETLILYRDDTINKRILEVRNQNVNLTKDWGGKALDKLLKESNIK